MSELLDPDASDLAVDAEQLLADLDAALPGAAGLRGECRPSLDVIETTKTVEIIMDLPGVPPAAIRVAIRRNAVLILGAKLPPPREPLARFHLAERSYGRFARVVRLGGAVDTTHARAIARAGQLRIVLTRLADRRGTMVLVPVEQES